MNDSKALSYRFRSFRLEVEERLLLNDETPVSLTPKAFDVLVALVESSGHLVGKKELIDSVWPDAFVEEANLTRTIHMIRRALGDDQNGNKFIETVAKKGYRFVADVEKTWETVRSETNGNDAKSAEEENGKHDHLVHEAPDPKRAPLRALTRRSKIIPFVGLGLLVIAVIGGLLIYRSFVISNNSQGVTKIAELPVRPLTKENRDAVYELGIANSLMYVIGSASGVAVRPIGATENYLDTNIDPVSAGREQQVDYVVASVYQIADGKVRVVSQLINVGSGEVEANLLEDGTQTTIFHLQDQVASSIGRQILLHLGQQPGEVTARKPLTANENAYRLYLQGRVLTGKATRKDGERAVEHLEQAVALDPDFALAFAALANARGLLARSGGGKSEQVKQQRAAVERALALDESLAEAHASLGTLRMNADWDFEGAERAFRRAIELDPGLPDAHRSYAIFLNSMGRFDEAISEIRKTIDLDPAPTLNHRVYGMILYYARRYDDAIAQLERTVEIDPAFRGAYSFLCSSYQMKGDLDKAFECFMRSPERKDEAAEKIESWKAIYASSGYTGIIRQRIEDAKKEGSNVSDWNLSLLYAEIGDKDKAFALIDKALPDRGWGWTVLKINPSFDLLRSDPRFNMFVRQIGLP